MFGNYVIVIFKTNPTFYRIVGCGYSQRQALRQAAIFEDHQDGDDLFAVFHVSKLPEGNPNPKIGDEYTFGGWR